MPIRILIVDDSESMRRLFTTSLDLEAGIEVVGSAGSASEAVEVVAQLRPDCVVLDWRMPEMDGPDAVPLLKAEHPAVKVVLFSNVYGPAAEQTAMERGADAFVEKQTNVTELVAAVKEMCLRD